MMQLWNQRHEIAERFHNKLFQLAYKNSRFLRRRILRLLEKNAFSALVVFLEIIEMLFFFVLLIILLHLPNFHDYSMGTQAVLLSVLSAIFFLCMAAFKKIPIQIEQKMRRDKQASKIYASLDKDMPKDFIFYIRRFFSDTGMSVQLDTPWYMSFSLSATMSSNASLETFLVKASPKDMPMIKIGGNRNSRDFGIGTRYYEQEDDHGSDEETTRKRDRWFEAFKKLALASKRIIVLPFAQKDSSLLDEIHWLKTYDLLEKTIFIMPPKGKVKLYDRDISECCHTYTTKAIWQESQKAIKQATGINLPDYRSSGGFISVKNDIGYLTTSPSGRNWKSPSTLRAMMQGTLQLKPFYAACHFTMRQLKYLFKAFIISLIAAFMVYDNPTDQIAPLLWMLGLFILATLHNVMASFNRIGTVTAMILLVPFYIILLFKPVSDSVRVLFHILTFITPILLAYLLYTFAAKKPIAAQEVKT